MVPDPKVEWKAHWVVSPSQGWSVRKLMRYIRNNAYVVLVSWAPIIETEMKENAPWTDRSSNARQTLETEVYHKSETAVALIARGRMSYQKYLELKKQGQSILSPELQQAGKHAVILPTIEANQRLIFDDIVEALKA